MTSAAAETRDSILDQSDSKMDSSCSVSVIIPVFNDQAGIDACLQALQRQAYPQSALDVIVVDNASEVPIRLNSSYSGFARLLVCSSPGAYAARNAGIAVATGDVLAFTDADCCPDPDWIAAGVAALQSGGDSCVVGGDVKMRLSSRPTAVELYQGTTGFMQRDNIAKRGFTVTANLFVRKSDMASIGPFDETLLSGGDREWSWQAARAGYRVKFAADAVVVTMPRTSMKSAIRQARRVAGGRYALRRGSRKHVVSTDIEPHRNAWQSARWILCHPDLSPWNRLRVFCVASVLYFAQAAETLRLVLGRAPERR